MKKLSILLAIITLSSCNKEIKKSARKLVVGDTITTGSGLQYIILKEGDGRKIEEGSKVSVYTNLYLNEDTNVFWTTATAKDSSFTFIHGKTSLIKGFTELHENLYEGDEVVAIIPYQLAYGPTERRGIPAKSTLIYNPLVVKSVAEPKVVLADTLYTITKEKSVNDAISFYKNASNTDYHTDLNLMSRLFNNLMEDSLFVDMEIISKFLSEETEESNDKMRFIYYQILSLEKQGKTKEAIELVEPLTKQEINQNYWKNYLSKLQTEK